MHYWYHRLAHEWDWLWRADHQMHHSAESLDAFGAYSYYQRPESHAIHHGRGIHRWNYADLPMFDLLFGTFRNPAGEVPREAGFQPGASARIGAMLAFRNVAEPA